MTAFCPLTKTVTLSSYVNPLREFGVPVDSALRRARLPMNWEEFPGAWIPYRPVRLFTAEICQREGEGIVELGLGAFADTQQALVSSFRNPVLSAPTLYQALQLMPALTGRQTAGIKMWLESAGERVRICLKLPLGPAEAPGYHIGELRTLNIIIILIRAYAGADFTPMRVWLASPARDLPIDPETVYGGVPVITDQPCGALEFPRTLLCLQRGESGACAESSGGGPAAPVEQAPETLHEALQRCLASYLSEGYQDIAVAAEIVGCSVRSLQRQLREEQTSFSKIIDAIRCRNALVRLRDDDISLPELALRLGYSEQSAFNRAFRRWTGTTPQSYRSIQYR